MIGEQIDYVLIYEGSTAMEIVYYYLYPAEKEAKSISMKGTGCTIQKWIWDEHFSRRVQDKQFEIIYENGELIKGKEYSEMFLHENRIVKYKNNKKYEKE